MAVLRIPEENRTISGKTEVAEYLGKIGIEYNVWQPAHPIKPGALQDEILGAYSNEIEDLKARGSYVTADVISVTPQTPNLDAMLAKFIRVPRGTLHWFDLCATKQIQCIRLFQDPTGWTPWYTDSGVDDNFEAVCFGRSFVA